MHFQDDLGHESNITEEINWDVTDGDVTSTCDKRACGSEALTLLEYHTTRTAFINELVEVIRLRKGCYSIDHSHLPIYSSSLASWNKGCSS